MPNLGCALVCALAWIVSSTALAAPIYPDTVFSFERGPQDIRDPASPRANVGSPEDALGPPDGAIVSLGERGQITVRFPVPLVDGPGTDLVVHENAFSFTDGGTGETFVFAELAFVEISSDGVIFARFPTFSPIAGPIGEFGIYSTAEVDASMGLAGLRVSDPSLPLDSGDPFDFSDLASAPVVGSGAVDLQAIRYVRIRDVIGDGSEFDRLGDPIFDPWPSSAGNLNAGFDLDAVVGVHSVPEPGTFALLVLAGLSACFARLPGRRVRSTRLGCPKTRAL